MCGAPPAGPAPSSDEGACDDAAAEPMSSHGTAVAGSVGVCDGAPAHARRSPLQLEPESPGAPLTPAWHRSLVSTSAGAARQPKSSAVAALSRDACEARPEQHLRRLLGQLKGHVS